MKDSGFGVNLPNQLFVSQSSGINYSCEGTELDALLPRNQRSRRPSLLGEAAIRPPQHYLKRRCEDASIENSNNILINFTVIVHDVKPPHLVGTRRGCPPGVAFDRVADLDRSATAWSLQSLNAPWRFRKVSSVIQTWCVVSFRQEKSLCSCRGFGCSCGLHFR